MGGRWFFRLPLIALIWFSSTPEAEILVKELRYGRRGGLDLVCRHDELIQVLSERLGYSSGGLRRSGRHRQRAGLGDRCRPRGTCSVPYSQANWYCRGLSTCSGMPIERRPLHRLTCGSDFTNCLRVEYQCVKKRILTNVCSRSTYEAQTGHVTSPSFPNSYPLRRDCACALSASGGTGNVVVRVSFFLLRFGEPCGDWLSLKPEANDDAKRPLPMERKRCGYIPEMERVEARSVALRFHSDSSDQDMGFWIQFSGSGNITSKIR